MARPRLPRVTSSDVARRAGVSRATVSYVLNNVPHKTISGQTRRGVMEAAEVLGYTPFGPARHLALGRSEVVLLVMPNWPISQTIVRVLDGLDSALAAHGLALLIHRQMRPKERVADVWKSIGPAGVIGLQAFGSHEATTMRRAGVAVARLVLEEPSTSSEPGVLTVPQRALGDAQVRHLASSGHRRIGYAYPSDLRVRAYAEFRLQGARSACDLLGVEAPRVCAMAATEESAVTAIRSWLEDAEAITAIAAYNDQWAVALLAGLHKLGVRVPDEIAVIGVDNDAIGTLMRPTLSTIDIDPDVIARYLSDTIVKSISGEPGEIEPVSLAVYAIARESAP